MKNLFDVMQGGNLGNIGQSLNSALGGKLDAVMKGAGGKPTSGGAAPAQSGGFGNVGTLLGSAAIGGVLGALFSGKKAKKMAKSAVLVGGTAAAGALAWNFYQKWAQNKNSAPAAGNNQCGGGNQFGGAPAGGSNQFGDVAATPVAISQTQAAAPTASNIEDQTALILLEAMVFAARADGHIDEEEKAYIHNAVDSLFPDQEMSAVLTNFLEQPVDPMSLACKVSTPEEAQDLYRLSCAAIEIDSYMERSYLDGLAKALHIEEAQKNQLEKEALAVRASME